MANDMSQSKSSELEDYVRRVGERIRDIHSRIIEIDRKMKEIEGKITEVRAELANNSKAISDLKESTVQKLEFDEFVNRLTESLRELLPPVSTGIEETQEKEE